MSFISSFAPGEGVAAHGTAFEELAGVVAVGVGHRPTPSSIDLSTGLDAGLSLLLSKNDSVGVPVAVPLLENLSRSIPAGLNAG